MAMKTVRLCPKCSQPLPSEAPPGLCPECLRKAPLETNTAAPAQNSPPALFANARNFGGYELLEEIARGGMGVVWKARQISLNRIVALKMILSGRLASEADVKRFRMEAEAAAKLQHPNIVAIHEVGAHDGQHFFSMDFVEGKSLAELVFHQPLPPEQAARFVRAIAEAIHYAHQKGVLHRDLKPSNVLIDSSGTPRVTDFGLAKLAGTDSGLTLPGAVMGSPSYMSPEQASGKGHELGPASDVYSLGAILYELLTGRPPFLAPTPLETMRMVVESEPAAPRSVNPSVPSDLNTICLKCLEKAPSHRYASAQELADELGRFLRHEPIMARPGTPLDRARKWTRRNPRVSAMAGLVLLVALLGFTAVWWQLQQTRAALRQAEQNAVAEATARAPVLSARVVMKHSNGVVSAFFNKDGRRILSASHDGTAKLWNALNGQALVTFTGHDGSLGPAQFSPDERRILTFGGDTQHRYPKLTPNGQKTVVSSSLRYGDQTVRVWDAATGQQLLLITNVSDQLSDAVFSPDGARIAASSLDGLARIWNGTNGQLLQTLTGHVASALGIRFSPEGGRMLTTSHGTKYEYRFQRWAGGSSAAGGSMAKHESIIARLWDVNSGRPAGELRNLARHGPLALLGIDDSHTLASFSPDGQWIVTAPASLPNLGIWDPRTRSLKRRLRGHSNEVNSAVFSPDGKRVLTASADHTARLWDVRSGNELAVFKAHDGPVLDAVFSADGKRIATASGDGTARIWDTTGRGLAILRGHEGKVFTVCFSPDGTHVVTASEDGTLRLWDAATLEQLAIPLEGHAAEVTFVQFSPDSRRLVTASDDKTARIWDAADGRFQRELKGLASVSRKQVRDDALGAVKRAVFSPDGKLVATGSDDQQVGLVSQFATSVSVANWPPGGELLPFHPARLYDANTGRELLGLPCDDCGVEIVAFSPDGTKLLIAPNTRVRRAIMTTRGGTRSGSTTTKIGPLAVQVWMVRGGQPSVTLNGHSLRVNLAVFSPDGRKILTADSKGMYVWEAGSGQQLVRLEKSVAAFCGEFSPDSQRILGLDWNAAAVWDANTGKQILRFKPQQGEAASAAFSPDGKKVLLCSQSGQADICDAGTGEQVGLSFGRVNSTEVGGARTESAGLRQGIFSPNGRLVATLDAKGKARVWDITSQPSPLLLATLEGHKAEVLHIAFSPDGRWLATASKDYTARLWPVAAMLSHSAKEK